MPDTYRDVEKRIVKAVDAYNTRKNAKRSVIAREFNVPYERLRARLDGKPSKSAVRGLHGRKLRSDQELALQQYFIGLDQMGCPGRLREIQTSANRILRQDADPTKQYPAVGIHWAKRWITRQDKLYKIKRKSLAAARKNAHNLAPLQGHFCHGLIQWW